MNAETAAVQRTAEWDISPSLVQRHDPLLICLSILTGLLGRPMSPDVLQSGLPAAEGRQIPAMCLRAAERAGYVARIVKRPRLAKISPLVLPCILLLKEGDACVLVAKTKDDTATIIRPESPATQSEASLTEIEQDYLGYAFFARPQVRFDSRAEEITLGRSRAWFWGTLAKSWRIYSHVVMASILINSFAIVPPLFIMNVYDRVVPNNALDTLHVLAVGVLTVFVFEFVIRNLRAYFVDIAGKNADVIIASRLMSQLTGMRLDAKQTSTGSLANNVREFEALRDFFTSGTIVVLIDLPFVFLFIFVIWLIAGPIAYVPLVAVPAVILIGMSLQYPMRRMIERTHKESSQKHALLFEAIEGLESIKTSGAEGGIQKRWEDLVGATAETSRGTRALMTFSQSFTQFAAQITTIGVVVYGVYLIGEGEMTVGSLVACTILAGRAMAPLAAVAQLLSRLQQSRVALASIDRLMQTPLERSANRTFLHRPNMAGGIKFQSVKFSYPGQKSDALCGVSFSIDPGERIGIIGRIGSGKSTIARLVLGLYEPSSGSVLIDDTDLRQIDPSDLRRNIGYVSQDSFLFFGSVRDNLTFGVPYADDQMVKRAAELSGVTDFLNSTSSGFDVQVGERGTALSGGQRQTIMLGRALLLDPPILVLDEPTSDMDNSTEARLKERMANLLPGRTLILITHRMSMIDLVDRLIVVDSGKVILDGPRQKVVDALAAGRVRVPGRVEPV